MKTIFTLIILGLFTFQSFGQIINPAVTGAHITERTLSAIQPYTEFSFMFANTESGTIRVDTSYNGQGPVVLTVSLINGTYDNSHYTGPLRALGGDYKDHFVWTYNVSDATYTGIQIQDIAAGSGGLITIGYKASTGRGSAVDKGFLVRVTSNGAPFTIPGSSDIREDDDMIQANTYLTNPDLLESVQRAGLDDRVVPCENIFSEYNLNSESGERSFVFYPNPVKDFLYINGSVKAAKFYDVSGKLVYERSVPFSHIDLRATTPGIYIVKITDHKGLIHTEKILKE